MQLSNSNQYLFNKKNIPQTYNNILPVYIAIPVIAFRVSYIEHENPENIIETTIVKLKKIGYSKERIAKTLCLDEHLVNDVLEYYGNDLSTNVKPVSQKRKTAYVFYNCYSHKYLDWCMEEEEFKNCTDLCITDVKNDSFRFKSSISDSFEYFVRILQNPDAVNCVGMVPKQEELLRIFQGKKKHKLISSTHYSNAEYLNESSEVKLVCACYFDARDLTDFTIANPICEVYTKTLWYNISELLNTYADFNQPLLRDLQNMKKRLSYISSEINTDEMNKSISEFLLKKYGNTLNYYPDVYKRLIQLERSYAEFKNSFSTKGVVADCQDELARFQGASYSLLEDVFRTTFIASYDENAMFKIGKMNKNRLSQELLRAYILILGFESSDETIYEFLKDVYINHIQRIFEMSYDNITKNINTWFMAHVIYAGYEQSLPIATLACKMPTIIQALQKTLAMRNPAMHGDTQIKLLSFSECSEIYNYCQRVSEIMLNLNNLCPEIDSYNFRNHDISAQVKILVNEKLKNVSTNNSELYEKAKTMCVSFYEKQESSFFADCSNYLHTLYFTYLDNLFSNETRYKMFSNETRYKMLEKVPDDTQLMLSYINRILDCNGIEYTLKSVIRKDKLYIDFNHYKKLTLTGAMYLTILFIYHNEPTLFKTIKNFGRLLEVTDQVVDKRGHSNLADFSKDEQECSEILEKLLSFIQKDEV